MKYKALLLSALFATGLCFGAEAAKQEPVPVTNPMDWQMSMMEEHSGKKNNEPIWVIEEENKFGVFAFDSNSLTFVKNGKQWDKNNVEVVVKTVFTDKEVIKKLNEKYAEKLQPKEKVEYWLLHMRFGLADTTYAIKKTEYFGSKGTNLETINRKVNMVAVPEGSFADSMRLICMEWADQNKDMEDPGKK